MKEKLCLWIKEHTHPIRIIGGVLFVLALICAILWFLGYGHVDAAAYLLQLISALLFAAPAIADYLLGIKPVRKMSYDEILHFIEKTHTRNDWHTIAHNDITECFLNIDPRLRFRMKYSEDGIQNENFVESWANIYPDSRATSYYCDLIYDSDFLNRIIIVSVDGGRAILPAPNTNTNIITKYNYHVAKIFDKHDTLDEYIRRSNLTVSKN